MFYTNRVLKDYKGKFFIVESRPDDVFQIQVNKMINNNLKIKKTIWNNLFHARF